MAASTARLSPHLSPQPSPRTSWDNRPQSQQYQSTTPFGHPMWVPTPSYNSTLLSARTPNQPSGSGGSPNYFGYVVDATNTIPNSGDANSNRLRPKPGQSPASIRSHAAASPKIVSTDSTSEFEAFRRRSEKQSSFTLYNSGLPTHNSSRSTSSIDPSNVSRYSQLDSAASENRPSPEPAQFSYAQNSNTTYQSPAPLIDSPSSYIGDRNPRLSLPTASLSTLDRSHNQRSSTLPTAIQNDGDMFCTAQQLSEAIQFGSQILIIDLRSSSLFLKGRIHGAINVCLSKVLLKRQSYNADKVADSIQDENQKRKFKTWRATPLTIVYDDRASNIQEAASLATMLTKFPKKERQGRALILKGGFEEFSNRYPELMDWTTPNSSPTISQQSSTQQWNLPVTTGCAMPSDDKCLTSLFSNLIRQSQDLREGVGRMPLHYPSWLKSQGRASLPNWLQVVANPKDEGATVAERFLNIEKAEQHRMESALSMQASSSLGAGSQPVWRIAGMEKGGKNRYNKIWPFEHSRVRLQNVPRGSCDYINANHVKAPFGKHRYIATQGPLPATFNDFWRVIWEQDVRVLVMLTAETEGGQIKCHPYWEAGQYGNMRIQAVSEHRVSLDKWKRGTTQKSSSKSSTHKSKSSSKSAADGPYVITRRFALSNSQEPFTPVREITQLCYTFWPDFGIPAHPGDLVGLVDQCNGISRAATSTAPSTALAASNRPVLVHCSAGCGRTGAFCTVDTVIEMLSRKRDALQGKTEWEEWMANDDVDLVEATVKSFREQRISLVQNLGQYVLTYQCIMEWIAGVIQSD